MLVTSLVTYQEIKSLLPSAVNLLAVSKGHSDSAIRELANYGQFDFGESRLQEALPKINSLSDINGIRWHFVGRLQANKVRGVVKLFDYIHSVDSLSLGKRISRISGEENRCPKVMIQVKFYEDPLKGGFSPDELMAEWSKLLDLPYMDIVGLMAIPPLNFDLGARKKLFKDCRDFANKLELRDCSMGMSADWKEAIEAGSTWIRVGSLLFGHRAK